MQSRLWCGPRPCCSGPITDNESNSSHQRAAAARRPTMHREAHYCQEPPCNLFSLMRRMCADQRKRVLCASSHITSCWSFVQHADIYHVYCAKSKKALLAAPSAVGTEAALRLSEEDSYVRLNHRAKLPRRHQAHSTRPAERFTCNSTQTNYDQGYPVFLPARYHLNNPQVGASTTPPQLRLPHGQLRSNFRFWKGKSPFLCILCLTEHQPYYQWNYNNHLYE